VTGIDRKVVSGFKVPATTPPTAVELAWIEFLRLICNDAVPSPTLALMQGLRHLIDESRKGVSLR
jgi:hypothetical protein